jgi:hypothetical protein
MKKITKHFQFRLVLALALILFCSQPLMAVTIFEAMHQIQFSDLKAGGIEDMDGRSSDNIDHNVLSLLYQYSDRNIYTVGAFDEGGLYGTVIAEDTAANGECWMNDCNDNQPSWVNTLGATGLWDGEYREGSNSTNFSLGDEVSIERAAGDDDEWMLQLNNGYAGSNGIDIYADGTLGNRVQDIDPDSPHYNPLLLGNMQNWTFKDEMYHLIALYIAEDIVDETITGALMRPAGVGIDYTGLNIEAGSWVLFWEDKINVDKPEQYSSDSDFDFYDLVIVLTPEEQLPTVPEPSTVILFTVGMVGFLGVRIRMKGKNQV